MASMVCLFCSFQEWTRTMWTCITHMIVSALTIYCNAWSFFHKNIRLQIGIKAEDHYLPGVLLKSMNTYPWIPVNKYVCDDTNCRKSSAHPDSIYTVSQVAYFVEWTATFILYNLNCKLSKHLVTSQCCHALSPKLTDDCCEV